MLAITTYQWLLSFHIFAAVVWVGGGIAVQIFALFALRSTLPGRKAEFSHEAGVVGQRVFAPASIILLLLGIWLMHHVGYSYGKPWVTIALIGWAASFVTGIAVLGPQSKKIVKAIETNGPDSPEASSAIDRILLVSRIDLAILIIVVFDMVLKPGGAF